MCQNSLVKTVVDGFVAKGFMFTAFDVTKFLRAGGNSVRHSEVNDAVKQMFGHDEMPDYERDTADVGAAVAPFVYYHRNSDISNYSSDWLENNPSQDGMLNDATSTSGVTQPSMSTYGSTIPVHLKAVTHSAKKPVLPKGVVSTDKEGRLYIAPVFTKSVGLKPNEPVCVIKDNSKLVVTKLFVNKNAYTRNYSVNKDGRIRICRSLLHMIAKDGVNFKVSTTSGNIEVVQA